jgi:hypothetical protein
MTRENGMITAERVAMFKASLRLGNKVIAHGLGVGTIVGLYPNLCAIKTKKRVTTRRYSQLVIDNCKILED